MSAEPTDPGPVPSRVGSPLIAGAALLVPAVFAFLIHQPILFASLGPTAVMQAHEPRHRSSRFSTIVAGHTIGFLVASATVWLLGLASTASVFVMADVSPLRAVAAVISLVAATWLELVAGAPHPPSASTTLLVALGSVPPTLHWFVLLETGVWLVAATGEVIRRSRLRRMPAAR